MTTRLVSQPAVSAALLATWLLAQNGVSAAQIALGAVVALAIPLFSARFWPDYPTRARYAPLARLAARLAADIIVANVRVAALVLGPRRRLRPSFLELPLAVTKDHAITLLASVISLTPGTVSANLSGDKKTLLIHALAVDDAVAEITRMKERYERLIAAAFEC